MASPWMGLITIPLLCLLGTLVLVVASYRLQLWDHISNYCSSNCFQLSILILSSTLALSTFFSFFHYLWSRVVNSHLSHFFSQLVLHLLFLGFSCSSLLLSPLVYLIQFFGHGFSNFDLSFLHSFIPAFASSSSLSSSRLHSILNVH